MFSTSGGMGTSTTVTYFLSVLKQYMNQQICAGQCCGYEAAVNVIREILIEPEFEEVY